MEMSKQACGSPGLKLGHNKTPTSTTSTMPTAPDSGNAAAPAHKRLGVSNYANQIHGINHSTRGTFKLPGYDTPKLDRLPAAAHTLFKQEQLLGMLEDFAKHMYDAITTNGIHVPPSITLGLNATGNIHVLGSHPDQGKIEALFGSQSSLTRQLHQIVFTSRVQQLASLQPGFTGDFFKYPANSMQQISFVHMRAVTLAPFSMTIDQPSNVDQASNSATPAVTNQGQSVELNLFHMVITRSKDLAASSHTTHDQAPAQPQGDIHITDGPVPIKSVPAEAPKAAIHPVITGHAVTQIPNDPKITLDDPVPPITAQPEAHTGEKHQHIHKGKLRCVINK